MKRYTVLLLRPDHVADGFGQDTYLAHVRAKTPRAAIKLAQQEVKALDGHDDVKAADYYPLITTKGWHDDLTPDSYR